MSDSIIKRISFILAILFLYVSVVQVGLNTFWEEPEYPNHNCLSTPKEVNSETGEIVGEEKDCFEESKKTMDSYNSQREKQHNTKFLVGTVISVITVLLVLFIKFNENIVYGLFGGGVISQLWTLRFVEEKNIIGFIALLLLFVVVIFFVQKKSKK